MKIQEAPSGLRVRITRIDTNEIKFTGHIFGQTFKHQSILATI